jgi:hypothetical protein
MWEPQPLAALRESTACSEITLPYLLLIHISPAENEDIDENFGTFEYHSESYNLSLLSSILFSISRKDIRISACIIVEIRYRVLVSKCDNATYFSNRIHIVRDAQPV